MDGERDAVMSSLGEFQRKQDAAVAVAAAAEERLRALQEKFRCAAQALLHLFGWG